MMLIKSDCLARASGLLQFFPLSVFLFIGLPLGTPQPGAWLAAFLAGGAAAIVQIMLCRLLTCAPVLNRLMLGVNLYLMLGGLAVLLKLNAALHILDGLRESGIFLSMLAVGIGSSVMTDASFIGVRGASRRQTRCYSVVLLALVLVATAASFYFRGQLVCSAVLPLIGLALANRTLRNRLYMCAGHTV